MSDGKTTTTHERRSPTGCPESFQTEDNRRPDRRCPFAGGSVVGPTRRRSQPLAVLLLLDVLLCVSGAKINHSAIDTCPDKCTCTPEGPSHVSANVTCTDAGLTALPRLGNMDVGALNLADNFIASLLGHSLQTAKSLRALNLARNRLTAIDAGAFRRLRRLKELRLDHNLLSSLHPDLFDDLSSLEYLDLSHNRLSTLPPTLFSAADVLDPERREACSDRLKLPLLRHLDMSENSNLGENLRSDMICFAKLQYLGLAGVGLSDPEVIAAILRRRGTRLVESLDVSDNRISFLAAAHLNVFMEKVRVLDLSGNPFVCDCSVLSTVHWLKSHRTTIPDDWILPTCRYPDGGARHVPVVTLTDSETKVKCDLAAKCRSRDHFALDQGFDPDLCPPAVAHVKIFTASRTTTVPLIPYDSIRTTYDPMLGWYTAMALMGMVLTLILCIVFDRIKGKYQDYRYRVWKRKVYKAMEAAGELPELCSESEPDPAGAGRGPDASVCPSVNDVTALEKNDSVDGAGRMYSGDRKCSPTPGDVCNNVRPPSRPASSSRDSLVRQVSSAQGSGPSNLARSNSRPRRRGATWRQGSRTSRGRLERCHSSANEGKARPAAPPGANRPNLIRSVTTACDTQPARTNPAAPDHAAGHRSGRRPAEQLSHSGAAGRSSGARSESRLSRRPTLARSASAASSACPNNPRPTGRPPVSRTDSTDLRTPGGQGARAEGARTKPAENNSSLADRRRNNYARLRSESHCSQKTARPTALGLALGPQPSPGNAHGANLNVARPPLWETLTHVMRELKVAEVNPDCPLHNRKHYQRLKVLIQNNPDQKLESLLEQLRKKY